MRNFALWTLALTTSLAVSSPPAGASDDERAEAGITVEDALAVPADPDDEADIRADNDPGDVGQEGLDAPEAEIPPSAGESPAQEP